MCVLAYEPLLAEMQYKQKSRFKYIILIYSAICLPLSQIYLGECSADEALFGLMMSLISTTLYHYILQRGLFLTVKKILSASTLIVGLVTLLLQIIFLSVPIVIFEVNLNTRQIPSLVSEGIAINCGRTQSSYKL